MSFLDDFIKKQGAFSVFRSEQRGESQLDFARSQGFAIADVAPPQHTVEEMVLLRAAADLIERAWEGGHFSDIEESTGSSLRRLTLAAIRANELLGDDRVTVEARTTALGDKLLVAIRGRI